MSRSFVAAPDTGLLRLATMSIPDHPAALARIARLVRDSLNSTLSEVYS